MTNTSKRCLPVIGFCYSVLSPSAVVAEPFLSLPFPIGTRTPGDCRGDCQTTGVCIFCKWSNCVDGTVYNHLATDYGCTGNDTTVHAAADGVVERASANYPHGIPGAGGGYGNHVIIRHPSGYRTWYAHLKRSTIAVAEGARVVTGQLLGLSDDTGRSSGPHLHFEVRDPQGRRVNPYGDPPNYTGGCGPNALWMTCPPTPAPPPDSDGDGFTVSQGDCDDRNRDVHPGAAESCNGRDDDCNGTSDDPWSTGLSIDLGRPCTVGIGACANDETWVCAPNGATAVCGATPLPPQTEVCNGLDDDCDGFTDEDWRVGLTTDLGQPCSVTWDACRGRSDGSWTCAPDGRAVVCDAPEPSGTPASAESCNDVDDDCDGIVDASERRLDAWRCRMHLSVAVDPSSGQLGIAATDYGNCPRSDTWWREGRMLSFERHDASGALLGEPIMLDARYNIHGVSVVAVRDGYTIVWLAYDEEPPVDSRGNLMLSRINASGETVVPPTALREVYIDRNTTQSQVRLVVGSGTLHAIVVDADPERLEIETPRWLAIDPESGGISEGDRIDPSHGEGWDILAGTTRVAIAGDTRIAAWVEQERSSWERSIVIASWGGDGVYADAVLEQRFDGGLGVAVACPEETSCIAMRSWESFGGRIISFSTVHLPTFEVDPLWAGWGSESWAGYIASMQLACHDRTCVPILRTDRGGMFSGIRVTDDGQYAPALRRIEQVCTRCGIAVTVMPTEYTVYWTQDIPAWPPPWTSPETYFVATTRVCPP